MSGHNTEWKCITSQSFSQGIWEPAFLAQHYVDKDLELPEFQKGENTINLQDEVNIFPKLHK